MKHLLVVCGKPGVHGDYKNSLLRNTRVQAFGSSATSGFAGYKARVILAPSPLKDAGSPSKTVVARERGKSSSACAIIVLVLQQTTSCSLESRVQELGLCGVPWWYKRERV